MHGVHFFQTGTHLEGYGFVTLPDGQCSGPKYVCARVFEGVDASFSDVDKSDNIGCTDVTSQLVCLPSKHQCRGFHKSIPSKNGYSDYFRTEPARSPSNFTGTGTISTSRTGAGVSENRRCVPIPLHFL